jgi:hypothetical protein
VGKRKRGIVRCTSYTCLGGGETEHHFVKRFPGLPARPSGKNGLK